MKGVAIYTGVFALTLVFFVCVPQIDLATSRLFYAAGPGFPMSDWRPVVILYHVVPWITWAVLALVGAAAIWLFLVGQPIWGLDRKALIFIFLTIALGPGLLANVVFKDHWGRARPAQIEAFGGTRQFTPAPLPATQCESNCSFVSGHAALGFSLVAFAFLWPPGGARRNITIAALTIGALVGFGRIVQGAHFLSDVVYAGLLVYGTTAVLHRWIIECDGLTTPPLVAVYRVLWRGAKAAGGFVGHLLAAPAARLSLLMIATVVLIALSIEFADRPLALFFHARDPDFRALFELTGRLGLTWGYLTIFGLAFGILHWGGLAPRLQPFAASMRAFSAVPAFLFVSIAASGIVVDFLKFILGRPRPKLLFNEGVYDFSWLGMHPDHWSFPSGHSATIVALMMALWCLWPRHLLFYVLVACLVASSRVAVDAHYLSDVLAGAFIAVLTTRRIALIFARSGIDLADARRGRNGLRGMPPWPCRRFVRAPREEGTVLAETSPLACSDEEGCSIGSSAVSGSRIDSPSWLCVSKRSTTSAAETLSTRP